MVVCSVIFSLHLLIIKNVQFDGFLGLNKHRDSPAVCERAAASQVVVHVRLMLLYLETQRSKGQLKQAASLLLLLILIFIISAASFHMNTTHTHTATSIFLHHSSPDFMKKKNLSCSC